jgi:hypothetical protein
MGFTPVSGPRPAPTGAGPLLLSLSCYSPDLGKVRERLAIIAATEETLLGRLMWWRSPEPPSQEEVARAFEELSVQPEDTPTGGVSQG